MSIPITLRQLEIFLAVARSGNVTRAAAALHLTQSATSMAIAQLEKQLDVLLFERKSRELLLTERGTLLLGEAPELLTRVKALPELLGGRGEHLRGELHVAASTTVGRYLLAPALAAFAMAHPAVSVQLSIGNTGHAAAALRAHRAEVAYVEGEIAGHGLVAESWKTDALEIVGSARHWKKHALRLSKTELPKLPWIMREPGSGTREVIERALRAARLPPVKTLMMLDDSEAILQVVASGVGVACLSRMMIGESLRAKRVIALEAPYLGLERTLWRVTRSGWRAGPLQLAFQSFLDSCPIRA